MHRTATLATLATLADALDTLATLAADTRPDALVTWDALDMVTLVDPSAYPCENPF